MKLKKGISKGQQMFKNEKLIVIILRLYINNGKMEKLKVLRLRRCWTWLKLHFIVELKSMKAD